MKLGQGNTSTNTLNGVGSRSIGVAKFLSSFRYRGNNYNTAGSSRSSRLDFTSRRAWRYDPGDTTKYDVSAPLEEMDSEILSAPSPKNMKSKSDKTYTKKEDHGAGVAISDTYQSPNINTITLENNIQNREHIMEINSNNNSMKVSLSIDTASMKINRQDDVNPTANTIPGNDTQDSLPDMDETHDDENRSELSEVIRHRFDDISSRSRTSSWTPAFLQHRSSTSHSGKAVPGIILPYASHKNNVIEGTEMYHIGESTKSCGTHTPYPASDCDNIQRSRRLSDVSAGMESMSDPPSTVGERLEMKSAECINQNHMVNGHTTTNGIQLEINTHCAKADSSLSQCLSQFVDLHSNSEIEIDLSAFR